MTEKPMSLRPRIVPSHIGDPVSFVTGLFGGHTIRVELEEIQGAELGRKYAVVDKRPLDPPPVVLCRFFDELGWKDGRRIEQEVDPDDASLGAICHVDLFAVPPCESVAASLEEQLWTGLSFPASTKFSFPSNYDFTSMIARSPITTLVTPSQDGQHGVLSLQPTITPDIIAYMGRSAIREDAKWNTMLAGGTFVQSSVINHNNKKAAVFVFPDLSVKAEGSFVLRYRVSTITSGCRRGDDSPHPVLAECFGTPFKIYSSKSFPGLRPSTALTKCLADHGVRVTMREQERRRRKRARDATQEPKETACVPQCLSKNACPAEAPTPPHDTAPSWCSDDVGFKAVWNANHYPEASGSSIRGR